MQRRIKPEKLKKKKKKNSIYNIFKYPTSQVEWMDADCLLYQQPHQTVCSVFRRFSILLVFLCAPLCPALVTQRKWVCL
jgi:hypothetical protein